MTCYLKHLLMEIHFDTILYSKFGNNNSYADHVKCSRGTQVPTPVVYMNWIRQSQPVSGSTVQQVAKFNYLGMVFTSVGW